MSVFDHNDVFRSELHCFLPNVADQLSVSRVIASLSPEALKRTKVTEMNFLRCRCVPDLNT